MLRAVKTVIMRTVRIEGYEKWRSQMGIREALKERRLFFDGGMGSLLQAKGLKPGELPETWNLLHPDIIVGIHLDYLKAGSDIVTTNTFG